MVDIGLNIRNLRKYKRMTQQEMSGLLHISRATLSNYERGKRLPDIYMIEKIADIFEVSIDYLMGRNH